MRIDVHAHLWNEPYLDLMAGLGVPTEAQRGTGTGSSKDELAARFAQLDAHRGDVRGQLTLTFQLLAETLDKAGFTLADMVQLRIFTTDIKSVTANYDAVTEALEAAGCRPTSVLTEIAALSDRSM